MRAARLGLVVLGVSVWWAGCTVEDGGDDDSGGEAGESGWSGKGGSGKGGSAGKAGSGGSTSTGGSGGSYAGSGAAPGSGGEAGWNSSAGAGNDGGGSGGESSGGTWGDSGAPGVVGGGEGGTPDKGDAGAGGEGEVSPVASCDPDEGDHEGTPYPDCEPLDSEDECEVCVQQNCCEESRGCWAYEPFNTCGWGGPDGDGEIGCYQTCIQEWVGGEAACDDAAHEKCVEECLTVKCEEISDATWALAVCMNDNCADECYGGACTY